ncbi:fibronectin type III domain-containing protein [Streptomyces seoulensis]|uniref:Fibronectin type III domain-containing protein n=2 Tax=Streptomyces seoulensis TaxID=73044 RepID=A0A4P6TPB2_STRSO|nr:fibronectin type III domain-containing protein [Streptomyces seoulensis]QBJ89115.1 fibronectin type III domain-containing protein [Streptomyces seoulensis]
MPLCAALLLASCGTAGGASDEGPAPGAPARVTAEAGSATSVHVMWNAAGSGVHAYEVYRGPTKVTEVPAAQHMVDVPRLRPSTMYAFTVRARSAGGRLGPPSREVRARTPAYVAADHVAPSRPGRVTGKVVDGRAVQLSWAAAHDDRGVRSYAIQQGGVGIHVVGGAQTATVVTGLRPGTRYAFTVRAQDAAGNLSPASTPVRLTTPGAGDHRGTMPTGFDVVSRRTAGSYYLDLSWDPPDVDGVITEYQIRLDGDTDSSLVWGGTPPTGRARHSLYAGQKAGETHRVRLRARLPDGTWGGFSAERTVTTGR